MLDGTSELRNIKNDVRKVSTKSSNYWENEFNSGKFTDEQVNELKKIPANQYSKIVASSVDRNYDDLIFEIPDRKNLRNKFLGRPDMIDAIDAFYDTSAIEIYDEDNSSIDEDRFKLIAMSKSEKILDVIYFVKEVDTIRIISVFKATKRRRDYMSQTKLDRIRDLRRRYQESPLEKITVNINRLALDSLRETIKKSGLEHYTIDMAISDIIARDMINHM